MPHVIKREAAFDGSVSFVSVQASRRHYVEIAASYNIHEDGRQTPVHRLCIWARDPENGGVRFVGGVSHKPNPHGVACDARAAAVELLPRAVQEAERLFGRAAALDFGRAILAAFDPKPVGA